MSVYIAHSMGVSGVEVCDNGGSIERALTPRFWRSAAEGSNRHNLDERP
jgi:hypothetical protein